MTGNDIDQLVTAWIGGKTFREIVKAAGSAFILADFPPDYRTALLLNFSAETSSRVVLNTEYGINGTFIEGSADVWNAEEFSPWVVQETTVIMGNLDVEGTLKVNGCAALYVAGNLNAANLLVAGELHCGGRLSIKNSLVTTCESYLAADEVNTGACGIFGILRCENVNWQRKFKTEREGLHAFSN